jgi:hypothetical protein
LHCVEELWVVAPPIVTAPPTRICPFTDKPPDERTSAPVPKTVASVLFEFVVIPVVDRVLFTVKIPLIVTVLLKVFVPVYKLFPVVVTDVAVLLSTDPSLKYMDPSVYVVVPSLHDKTPFIERPLRERLVVLDIV